jgi:hypothetical protein
MMFVGEMEARGARLKWSELKRHFCYDSRGVVEAGQHRNPTPESD